MSAGKIMLVRAASFIAVGVFLWLIQTVLYPYLQGLGGFDNRLITLSALFGVLAVSLNLINGITGQFSIGHAAFYMIGAYATGYITILYYRPGQMENWIWLLLMIGVGALAAGIAGFVVGLPSLRLRGDYLAVVTLGFGEIVRIIVQNVDALGGSYGLTVAYNNAPVKITPLWMVVLLFVFSIAACRNILKTAHGLPFLAVREDELAANAMGVNTTKTKVTAFVIGAAMAGMAGALFSHYEGFITLKQFDMNQSFMILTMVVIGGTGSITGAAVAGILLTLLPESLRDLPPVPAFSMFGFVVAAIVVLLVMSKVRRRIDLNSSSALRSVLAFLGLLGVLGGIYVAIMAYSQALPLTTRVTILILAFVSAIGLIFTRRRLQNLSVFGYVVGLLLFILVLTKPAAMALEAIPLTGEVLKGASYEAGKLRFPFFAIMLVGVMLTRPQGLFGHHEFSWSWIKSLFGRPTSKAAVAA